MRYSLMNFIRCPVCHGEFCCLTGEEESAEIDKNCLKPFGRISQAGAVVGPLPAVKKSNPLIEIIRKYAIPAGPAERNHQVEVNMGILVCTGCSRWYPVDGFIPELLPDHLRDWQKESRFLESFSPKIERDLWMELSSSLKQFQASPPNQEDKGRHFKVSEGNIEQKISDPDFFGPGYYSPFNRYNPKVTEGFIRNFAVTAPLLKLNQNDIVLDVCTAYSWTTEWLFKMGYEAIGIDICRTYLEIGVKRMSGFRPHLLIADVENLPVADKTIHAILGFDGFHHIFNRKQSMAHFYRVLTRDGRIVLAEPGGEHEHQTISQQMMKKFDILEKGMDREDVESYSQGLKFLPVDEYFMVGIRHDEVDKKLTPAFLASHSLVNCKVFVIKKKSLTPSFNRVKTRIKNKVRRIIRENNPFKLRKGLKDSLEENR